MVMQFLGWVEKVLFTLALFLLTDKLIFFVNFLGYQPYPKELVRLLTGMPRKDIGPMVASTADLLFLLLGDVAFWIALVMILTHRGLLAKTLKTAWTTGLAVLLLLASVSWFWSENPNATLNGLWLLMKITVIGLYLSQRFSIEENLELLVWVVALGGMLSLLAVWLTPGQSIHPGGEWRGIYSWKNLLGRLMAFGNAILIVYWFAHGALAKRIFAVGLFVLSGVLLVFSDSATSLLTLVGMYGVLALYGAWTKWGAHLNARTRWSLVALGVALMVLAWWNVGPILDLFGKSSTLSGRTALWEILWGWFQQRPLLGFGYEAFWVQFPEGLWPPGDGWVEAPARHAHNGYIEIILGLGLIGLALFLLCLMLAWKRAFMFLNKRKQVVFLWPLLILVYLTFANLAYSLTIGFPEFHWTLFVIAVGTISSAMDETGKETAYFLAPTPTESR